MADMHEVMDAMEQRARELGWDVESNWRDGFGEEDDDPASYDVYLTRATSAETQTGGTE